jgi:glycosyltransferase involved in cell wall biosynthesis
VLNRRNTGRSPGLARLRIADWLVHGGHQYEFFKANHLFYCTNPNRRKPDFKSLGRPKNVNVKYVTGKELSGTYFDIVMVRAGVDYSPYNKIIKARKIPGIAVMQTYLPYDVPKWTRCVVWNSRAVMDKHKGQMPRQKHFYIPHGFDPLEFNFLNLDKNGRTLSAASLFEKRRKVLGFNEWRWVADELGLCDLIGHGNENIKECIGSFPLERLVRMYNKYSLFLNTTTKSAMPRTRAEALMCGTPLITTKNFGIENYLIHGKNCLYADTKEDMLRHSRDLLASKDMQESIGLAGREAAILYFNIKEYIYRWEKVFEEAVR